MASLQQQLPLERRAAKLLGRRQNAGMCITELRECTSSSAAAGCSGRVCPASGRLTSSFGVVAVLNAPRPALSSASFKCSSRLKDTRRFIRESLKYSYHEVVSDKKIPILESVVKFIQDGRCKQTAMAAAVFMALSLLHGDAVNAEAMVGFVPVAFPWQKESKEQLEPPKGNCATCIGVVDETLGACSATTNCVSSFDDRPRFFVAPWEFPGQLPFAVKRLKDVLVSSGANIEEQGERYVHAIFTSKDGFVDDVEFLFSNPREDATVVIRSASRAMNMDDNQRNRKRLEVIRKSLTWEQVPILRNRKRAFFFLESPWDTFGPEPPPSFEERDLREFSPD